MSTPWVLDPDTPMHMTGVMPDGSFVDLGTLPIRKFLTETPMWKEVHIPSLWSVTWMPGRVQREKLARAERRLQARVRRRAVIAKRHG